MQLAVRLSLAVAMAVCLPYSTEALSNGETYEWKTTSTLPVNREQLGAVAYNGYVYAIGGDGGVCVCGTGSVYYAPILADGGIGAWVLDSDSPLAVSRHRHSLVIVKGFMYVIGGNYSGNAQATVQIAPINADGSLGQFTTTTPLPAARRRHTSWVINDYIFVAGGSNPGFDTVYSGHVADNGTVESWNLVSNPLPGKRYYQGSTLWNNYAYVIGGYDETGASTNTVFFAKVNSDGTTEQWQTSANTLPTKLAGLTAFTANGHLYAVGGEAGTGVAQSAIYFANIKSDGSIGAWATAVTPLPSNKVFHAMAAYNNVVYSIGGDSDTTIGGATGDVYSLITSPPPHWEITDIPRAVQGQTYSTSSAVVDGLSPVVYSISSGSLPAGITLDPTTGGLSGIPLGLGSSTFTLAATDAYGHTALKEFSLFIDPVSVSVSNPIGPLVSADLRTVGGECRGINPAQVSLLGANDVVPPQGATVLGGISYVISCPSNGDSSSVAVSILTRLSSISRLRIYKGISPNLQDITDQVKLKTTQQADGLAVEFEISATDGGKFDDDEMTNGSITDPLYVVSLPGTLASTGINMGMLTAFAAITSVAGIVMYGLTLGIPRVPPLHILKTRHKPGSPRLR